MVNPSERSVRVDIAGVLSEDFILELEVTPLIISVGGLDEVGVILHHAKHEGEMIVIGADRVMFFEGKEAHTLWRWGQGRPEVAPWE